VIFVILSLVLFLGIAGYQAIQGTFSALIMLVLTILSGAVAANYYVPLSQSFLLEYIGDYADAASLAGIFFITLMVLRALSDHFIRGNVVIYNLPNKIAAGALSIPTALIIVGMADISFEMLPFGDRVLMFERFKVSADRTVKQGGLFPYADEAAGWFLTKFSGGSLAGGTEFGLAHPDWAAEASADRIAVQKESKHVVPPASVQVTKAWRISSPLMVKEFTLGGVSKMLNVTVSDKLQPRDGYVYLAVEMNLNSNAADGDGNYRFGWGQVRLSGYKGTAKNKLIDAYAIGVQNPNLPAEFDYLRIKVPTPPPEGDDEALPGERNYGYVSKSGSAVVVFEVPEDFTPVYLVFKRYGKAAVPKIAEKAESPAETPKANAAEQPNVVGGVERPGWHSELQLISKGTGFTSELPFALKSGAVQQGGSDVEISMNKFVHGHISGNIGGGSGLDSGSGMVVNQFEVPSEKRLLRLECVIDPAQSSILRPIFSAVQGVVQKKAIAKDGHVFLPVGQYIVVGDGAEQQVELVYDPDAEMTGRVEPLQSVKMNELGAKSGRLGLLYLVPPGTELERFELGGTPIEAQTLRLKAPQ
jgi:hypothetical protein